MKGRGLGALALAMAFVAAVAACQRTTESVVTASGSDPSPALGGASGARGSDREAALPTENPYRGLGTWVDIYDAKVWEHPERSVRSMRAHGVATIYLQTSNFSRGRPFVHPVDRLLDAAARYDVSVVAWYLPGFRDVRTDLRRALAAIRLRTPSGNGFDSFALDIESPEVRRQGARTRRLLALSERLRRAAGAEYRLGAIVPSPRGVRANAWYWPSFPYRRLAGLYDVFLPMTYFTWRGSGREDAERYTAKNVLILRQETSGLNVPIHVIGGIASDASPQETRGFVDAVRSRNVIGASYYTFPMIRSEQWKVLGTIR